ncbi:hypothetical protein PLANTIT3_20115 [Plantibacter sp. T3]|nr:hypothetical protein PLANTIT3_20115 [Plantibacter sp. T3]
MPDSARSTQQLFRFFSRNTKRTELSPLIEGTHCTLSNSHPLFLRGPRKLNDRTVDTKQAGIADFIAQISKSL